MAALFKLAFFCSYAALFASSVSFSAFPSDPDEKNGLLAFKQELGNPTALSSWDPSKPYCEWEGVACRDGRIVSLRLPSRSLDGRLPSSLFSLSGLAALDLSDNVLRGELPDKVANLSRLKMLSLSRNSLSGEIPSRLGELTHLKTLKLAWNRLSGKIPPELGKLMRLRTLALSNNGLSGSVPSELGELSQLRFLDLSNNGLSGSIPGSFFTGLSSLLSLDVSNNSFSGEIPPQVGNLKNLRELMISMNEFSGPLPPEIGDLSSLESFYLFHCSIAGPLPEEMSKLKSLKNLDISYNPLRSPIPKFIGKLKNLSMLDLVYADLNGSIPRNLGSCINLKSLDLSFNFLTGSLPEELSRLPMWWFSAAKNQLSGPLPSWLGKWEQVESIQLTENMFSGSIPPEIGHCSNLKYLSLGNNNLTGPIPREICGSGSLLDVELRSNSLSGTIDDLFVNCTSLMQLDLTKNRISGSIPEYLSRLPLAMIEFDFNYFSGTIPVSLWSSAYLMEFSAESNFLEGSLPSEIGKAEALEVLVLSKNRLNGSIPQEIGNLGSLLVLNLNSNELKGAVPPELGQCSFLNTLDLGNNHLSGSIPDTLSDLPQLQCLVLSHNNLSGLIPSKPSLYFRQVSIPEVSFLQHRGLYDLSYNKLSGPIPEELGSCVLLVELILGNNNLSGRVPGTLFRLTNLITLDLSENSLTGEIPSELGDLKKLQGFYLGYNQLTGPIPETVGILSGLVKLNLTSNMLSGSVPHSFGNLNGLTHLDLSFNNLEGNLPPSLSRVQNLVGLYVQNNKLSGGLNEFFLDFMSWGIETMNLSHNYFNGVLPASLGNLSYLMNLDVHHNMFTGEIPLELGNLTQLAYLDLSGNDLSGHIPDNLCRLNSLSYINMAANGLRGLVPQVGICHNLSRNELSGNKDLCGNNVGSRCRVRNFTSRVSLNTWGTSAIIIGIVMILFYIAFAIWRCVTGRSKQSDLEETEKEKLTSFINPNLYFLESGRFREPLSINLAMFERPLLKLTFADILEATDKFCKTKIIGDGGFGTVYKATLPDGRTVAVKKLNEGKTQGDREFAAEMETLGKVKHRNLVTLLGYCSHGEEKLLVYDYMVNGSLDLRLRDQTGTVEILSWAKRFKIATGAARGLAFLHHGFTPHIIHRDMKSSNILLDEEFEPKVSDFGLARLISACETHVTTEIAGTLGYIPPEYGQIGRSTTKGDVYSFGVILLELLTGKEPTGPDFKDLEGGNLVGWVLLRINKGHAIDVLDPAILRKDSKQTMLKMLQIATACLSDNPGKRPTMLQVLKFLEGIEKSAT